MTYISEGLRKVICHCKSYGNYQLDGRWPAPPPTSLSRSFTGRHADDSYCQNSSTAPPGGPKLYHRAQRLASGARQCDLCPRPAHAGTAGILGGTNVVRVAQGHPGIRGGHRSVQARSRHLQYLHRPHRTGPGGPAARPFAQLLPGRRQRRCPAFHHSRGRLHAGNRLAQQPRRGAGSVRPGAVAASPRGLLPGPIARHYQLAHCAVAYFDADPAGAAFVRGLDEELVHQLYSTFGATIVPCTRAGGAAAVSHRLEGSVRIDAVDAGLVRLSLRVVDNRAGSVVWSQQFDTAGALSIELQASLAGAACAALSRYFAHG